MHLSLREGMIKILQLSFNTIQNRIIYNKNVLDVSRFIILSFAFFFVSSVLNNHHSTYASIVIIASCLLLLVLTIVNTTNGFLFILFITPFFGNHPGGKFLEIFDMLLLLWISIAFFRIKNFKRLTFISGFEWLFLLSGLLSILFNPDLLYDIILYFKNTPTIFHVFSAGEWNPLYSLKMLFSTLFCIISILILYNIYLEEGLSVINKIFYVIAATLFITIITGMLEAYVPIIKSALDKCHILIDGYVDLYQPLPLGVLTHLQRPLSVQSFFWNRGWYAVFLIAALPFVHVMVTTYLCDSVRLLRHKLFIGALYTFFLFYFLILISARGALLGFCTSFIVFILIATAKENIISKLKFIIPGLLVIIIILAPLLNVYTEQKIIYDSGRLEFFKAGIEIFKKNIFLGCGLEGYGIYNGKYLVPAGKGTIAGTAHNQLLQVASGQGLAGVLVYLSMIYYVLFSLIKSIPGKKKYITPLLSGFIGILVYSSFQEWFYLRSVQLLWWLLIMVIMVYCNIKPDGSNSEAGNNAQTSRAS
jgi:O-antigen ligase